MKKIDLKKQERFENRHNGPDSSQVKEMLSVIGVDSIDQLINETIPQNIRLKTDLNLPKAKSEHQFLRDLKTLASKNKIYASYIGMGYYNTFTPAVIQRNILENPGWYTAYTPYQAEIAQGRLEALINFQTMVMDLTAMEIANASLLDEGTAAAEAMSMLYSVRKGPKKGATTFFVDQHVFPQTLDILKTRSEPIGIKLEIGDINEVDFDREDLYGIFVQYPNNDGHITDLRDLMANAKAQNIFVAVAADLLSLTILTPPGEMGADVVVGSTQRFGIPMGYGGPHAAYFATREAYKRQIPGRIIGVSVDTKGRKAYRMALQTREQHIRREKATSNICTAQVLLAVMAGMYAVYHGKEGLKDIALKIHGLTQLLDRGLEYLGYEQSNTNFFDTLKVTCPDAGIKEKIRTAAIGKEMNFRYFDGLNIGISLDETCEIQDVQNILEVFAEAMGKNMLEFKSEKESESITLSWPKSLTRQSDYLSHPVFNSFHSEHNMLRYLKQLENKDLSLVHSMISLGSCTMKLNATSEMIPVTWPEFGNIHPFAPIDQVLGYQQMCEQLSEWLSEITGFAATSLQPNSGAQGEYAGLMVIKACHESRNQYQRNITLIPSSAHGTNPASAVMAGMKVVIVKCDERGNIDVEDLKLKATENRENLAALMVTYPSTHGVFEESIKEICQVIHDNGGLVYMDGANMNAQVGLTSPASIGADVCHLNLHKTFCIPHGGGGPGMGPICVTEDLKPFLPGNPVIPTGGEQAISAISAAPFGSASILLISYAYIAMMGRKGLSNATKMAILNANYIKNRIAPHYKILYTGVNGRSAHEMIIDCNEFKKDNIEVEDIAKRLMDYGFHAPTVSFPVAGTMMIEPTESETKDELDRFCEALIEIRSEISEIQSGVADRDNNVLKNAPHTAEVALAESWDFPYTRAKAVYPLEFVKANKFWPAISRIDSAYGDRNLVCSCVPLEAYMEEVEAVLK
ncbi:aminomethyl-transferring glycine dehydrogenase [Fulvivirgaceae bacterium BMA12]|uniref:Glycine dehydrogenase (decarboxylating) n=1 Tax=Agaribacillus aureus TaxID=3051825 RepID=A0ABT8LE76_9BACT|nr:aminomethyl-transferring glycine dehydrogenase [Fulvivirgaceae bacterium BMA12]